MAMVIGAVRPGFRGTIASVPTKLQCWISHEHVGYVKQQHKKAARKCVLSAGQVEIYDILVGQ